MRNSDFWELQIFPSNRLIVLHGHPGHFLEGGGGEFAVHATNECGGDSSGADGFAGVVV